MPPAAQAPQTPHASLVFSEKPPGIFQALILGCQAIARNKLAVIFPAAIFPGLLIAALKVGNTLLQASSNRGVFNATISNAPSPFFTILLFIPINAILLAATLFAILAGLRGKKVSVGEAMKVGFTNVIRFSLISTLLYISTSIVMISLIFLLIILIQFGAFLPGFSNSRGELETVISALPLATLVFIPFASRLIFAYSLAIDSPMIGAWSAFRSSWSLTKGYTLRIAGIIYVTIALPTLLFVLVLSRLIGAQYITYVLIAAAGYFGMYIISLSALLAFYDFIAHSQLEIGAPSVATINQAYVPSAMPATPKPNMNVASMNTATQPHASPAPPYDPSTSPPTPPQP